jgi:hypothetical protein
MSVPGEPAAALARHCRFCGHGLTAEATFCTECERFQSWNEHCWACRSPMDPDAERCPECKELQSGVECRACRVLLPPGAKICRECKSPQIFSGYLQLGQATLALVIALISVLGALGPQIKELFATRRAELVFEVDSLRENEQQIVLFVKNLGSAEGFVQGVLFEGDGVERRRLQFESERVKRSIGPGKDAELLLGPPAKRWKFDEDLHVKPGECRSHFASQDLRLLPDVAGVPEDLLPPEISSPLLHEFLCKVTE